MANQIPTGPFRLFKFLEGIDIPFYLIPFDKDGVCIGPETRNALITEASGGDFTDVIIFSHGWNNDFHFAVTHYEEFISGYTSLRNTENLSYQRAMRPLLVGIIWPSTALVLESEQAPDFAGGAPEVNSVANGLQVIQEISAGIPASNRERFCALAQRSSLNSSESLELATLLLPQFQSADDELQGARPLTAEELLAMLAAGAKQIGAPSTTGDFGLADDGPAGMSDNAQAAGVFSDAFNSVRDALRLATVWQMKDRAGVVGSNGVGPLLDELLGVTDSRVHLVGHSYGGKVCLSALCREPKKRPVDSVLLLEPAVSGLCFTNQVPGENHAGGYFCALDGRVKQPILTTFSANDFPLTKVFHLAVRRNSDLGEVMIGGAPPSRYAALGGFGPQGIAAAQEIKIKLPTERYDLSTTAPRIYGLEGTEQISSHGGVSNAATWWALFNQLDQA